MRIAVTGATGNVGTSVVSALAADPEVDSILGLARRPPALSIPKVSWVQADVTGGSLARQFEGVDAVIHLAWLIQPSRNRAALRAANVAGSELVAEAVLEAEVPVLIYASSVGAYSPGPKDRRVDESWPTEGIEGSFYSEDKVAVERFLDEFERRVSGVRVVRLRPGLIFKREAATEIRRLFVGPLAPSPLFNPKLIPFVPRMANLRFQAVHADDVADAYRLAVLEPVSGAFNIAADPVLDPDELASLLDARTLRIPPGVVRRLVSASWRARLQPTPPGWLDLALSTPLMDTRRAREELGWTPRRSAGDALLELLAGIRDRAGLETPPLDPRTSGRLRANEFRTGIGGKGL